MLKNKFIYVYQTTIVHRQYYSISLNTAVHVTHIQLEVQLNHFAMQKKYDQRKGLMAFFLPIFLFMLFAHIFQLLCLTPQMAVENDNIENLYYYIHMKRKRICWLKCSPSPM